VTRQGVASAYPIAIVPMTLWCVSLYCPDDSLVCVSVFISTSPCICLCSHLHQCLSSYLHQCLCVSIDVCVIVLMFGYFCDVSLSAGKCVCVCADAVGVCQTRSRQTNRLCAQHVNTRPHTYTHTNVHTSIKTHTHIHGHIHTHAQMRMHLNRCMRTFIQRTCIHKYLHTCIPA